MAKQMACRLGLGLAAAALLSAQSANVAGPSAGLVFEKAGRTLRPVMGIPGSALIGDPIKLEFEASAVHMAPRQDAELTPHHAWTSAPLLFWFTSTRVHASADARAFRSPDAGARLTALLQRVAGYLSA